ncbi:MAG: hypothetical protein HFE63_04505 [Clostridiales bacterium]|nr:hypothetical protein [Clostridiales bacterium]
MAVFNADISSDDRLIFIAEVVVFGGLAAFAAYRIFYLGLVWVEYDNDKVIFHYSKNELYEFSWSDIPGSRIGVVPSNGGYVFSINGSGKKRDIPLNRMSKGYKDFENTLKTTGVLKRIGVLSKEEWKQNAEQILDQFQRYCEANPGAVRPKPEDDCTLCPACQGKGIHFKKLPIVKLDVGKVCKTCGGSGYIKK